MALHDPSALTGADLKLIREQRGMTQTAFWGAIGVKQCASVFYEAGRDMPEPVRRLAWLHYVAGIPVDADPEELAKLGQLAAATRQFKRDLRRAENIATSAVSKIMEARQVLGA